MSTVLLTPTHIGHDYGVLIPTYTTKYEVDASHKKVFISPDSRMIVGMVGSFRPELIEQDDVFAMLNDIATLATNTFPNIHTMTTSLDCKNHNQLYRKAFGDSPIFLVTKLYQFILYYSSISKSISGSLIRKFGGLGSGGPIGVGLLRGGKTIHEVWPIIHSYDSVTSELFNVIDLNILKDWEVSV